MNKLGIAGIYLVTDLIYLQLRAIDNFRYILEVPKMKIYNLVKIMHKDSRADLGMLNTIGMQCRLKEINRNMREAIEHRNEENDLAKYAIKLVLLKFN